MTATAQYCQVERVVSQKEIVINLLLFKIKAIKALQFHLANFWLSS